MSTQDDVLAVLDDVLSLNGRAKCFALSQPLLGAVPELDSIAVIGILNSLEDQFGFVVEDDEIDGSIFETVGSLVAFVERKLA